MRTILALALMLLVNLGLADYSQAKPRAYFDAVDGKIILFVDGEEYHPNFWTGYFYNYDAFQSHDEAHRLAQESYRYGKIGSSLIWGLGVGGPIATIILARNTDMGRGTASALYWGSFLGGLFSGSYYHGKANIAWLRAINHYNGVYDSNQTNASSGRSWSVEPMLETSGLGLSLNLRL